MDQNIFKDVYRVASTLDLEQLDSVSSSLRFLNNLEDHFSHKELIGSGAIKDVYKCYDKRTQRYVALAQPKEFTPPIYYDTLVHEAWITSCLSHPNIIKVYEVGINESKVPYFTMDLKQNHTLKDFTLSLPLTERLLIFDKIGNAISYAHSQQIVHLDLKPENIQCDKYGEVLVCDWGLAKHLGDPDHDEVQLNDHLHQSAGVTLTGQVKGSPGYMSPEQIHGKSEKDTRSDIFSLGAILYLLLVGRPPFEGSQEEILEKTTHQPISFPSRHNLPHALRKIIERAMQKDPARRYQAVSELLSDLQAYRHNKPTLAENASLARQAYLFTKRHTVAFSLLSVVSFSCLSVYLMLSRELEQKEQTLEAQRAKTFELTKEVFLSNKDLEHVKSYLEEVGRDQYAKEFTANGIRLSYIAQDVYLEQNGKTVVENIDAAKTSLKLACRFSTQNNGSTHAQLAQLHFYTLDFQALLALPERKNDRIVSQYRAIAQRHPHYNFHSTNPPTVDDLNLLFQHLPELETLGATPFIICAVYYQNILNLDPKKTNLAILKLMEQAVKYGDHGNMSYVYKDNRITIKSDRYLPLHFTRHDRSLASFLKADRVTIHAPMLFHLKFFNNMQVKYLDLSKTRTISADTRNGIPENFQIPGLERLILPEANRHASKFREQIKHYISDPEVQLVFR